MPSNKDSPSSVASMSSGFGPSEVASSLRSSTSARHHLLHTGGTSAPSAAPVNYNNNNNGNGYSKNSNSSFESQFERKLKTPFYQDEDLAQEVLSKAGPANTYLRADHSHDIGLDASRQSAATANGNHHLPSYITETKENLVKGPNYTQHDFSQTITTSNGNEFKSYEENYSANFIKIEDDPHGDTLNSDSNIDNGIGDHSSSNDNINQDPDPIHIMKPNTQNVVYKQQVNIRYLQPPTPPPPAPIIIRERQLPSPPSQPPIIIRQTAPAPPTPVPLIIRERAPTPPNFGEPTIIERTIAAPPPAPRQVIIERVPPPPPKPRTIVYEKWLPYKQVQRPVIVQKIKPNKPKAPKNIIIEYEKPKCVAVRQVVEEGIFRVDPITYSKSLSDTNGEVRIVDRITDLPLESSSILSGLSSNKLDASRSQENLDELDQIYTEILNSYKRGVNSSSNNSSNTSSSGIGGSFNSRLDTSTHGQFYSTLLDNLVDEGMSSGDVEYETVTTTVSEALAAKIIAEAKAAGVMMKLNASNS